MKGCLKFSPAPTPLPGSRSSRSSSGASTPDSSCHHYHLRKCVAFGAEGSEEVYTADEWDRTPTEPARKLTYQDLLELKEIQRSLPRANQPPDVYAGRPTRHYLSGVPIGLLPLLAESPSESPSSLADADTDTDEGNRRYGRGFGFGYDDEMPSSPPASTTTTSAWSMSFHRSPPPPPSPQQLPYAPAKAKVQPPHSQAHSYFPSPPPSPIVASPSLSKSSSYASLSPASSGSSMSTQASSGPTVGYGYTPPQNYVHSHLHLSETVSERCMPSASESMSIHNSVVSSTSSSSISTTTTMASESTSESISTSTSMSSFTATPPIPHAYPPANISPNPNQQQTTAPAHLAHLAHLLPSRPIPKRVRPTFAFIPLLDTPPPSSCSSSCVGSTVGSPLDSEAPPSPATESPNHSQLSAPLKFPSPLAAPQALSMAMERRLGLVSMQRHPIDTTSDAGEHSDSTADTDAPSTPSLTDASLNSSPRSRASSVEPREIEVLRLSSPAPSAVYAVDHCKVTNTSRMSEGMGSMGSRQASKERGLPLSLAYFSRPGDAWSGPASASSSRHSSRSREREREIGAHEMFIAGSMGEAAPAPVEKKRKEKKRNFIVVNDMEIELDDDDDEEEEDEIEDLEEEEGKRGRRSTHDGSTKATARMAIPIPTTPTEQDAESATPHGSPRRSNFPSSTPGRHTPNSHPNSPSHSRSCSAEALGARGCGIEAASLQA